LSGSRGDLTGRWKLMAGKLETPHVVSYNYFSVGDDVRSLKLIFTVIGKVRDSSPRLLQRDRSSPRGNEHEGFWFHCFRAAWIEAKLVFHSEIFSPQSFIFFRGLRLIICSLELNFTFRLG